MFWLMRVLHAFTYEEHSRGVVMQERISLTAIAGWIVGVWIFLSALFAVVPAGERFQTGNLVFVWGGTFVIVLLLSSVREMICVFRMASRLLLAYECQFIDTICFLVSFSEKSSREGRKSLRASAKEVEDEFLKHAILLASSEMPSEQIQQVLEVDAESTQRRHQAMHSLLAMGAIAAVGLGVLYTLIQFLGINLGHEVSSAGRTLGPFLSLVYGFALAIPLIVLRSRLQRRTSDELWQKRMIIVGCLAIRADENPRILEDKLFSFLDPRQRPSRADDDETLEYQRDW